MTLNKPGKFPQSFYLYPVDKLRHWIYERNGAAFSVAEAEEAIGSMGQSQTVKKALSRMRERLEVDLMGDYSYRATIWLKWPSEVVQDENGAIYRVAHFPRDTIDGYLEVGTNGKGEVVINHPKIQVDESGAGHIVFSPRQARELARTLYQKAQDAETEPR